MRARKQAVCCSTHWRPFASVDLNMGHNFWTQSRVFKLELKKSGRLSLWATRLPLHSGWWVFHIVAQFSFLEESPRWLAPTCSTKREYSCKICQLTLWLPGTWIRRRSWLRVGRFTLLGGTSNGKRKWRYLMEQDGHFSDSIIKQNLSSLCPVTGWVGFHGDLRRVAQYQQSNT